MTQRDGKEQKATTPQLCLFKVKRLDCQEQAMCTHGFCHAHCWVRSCKAKRQRVEAADTPPSSPSTSIVEDDPPDRSEAGMDTSADGKVQVELKAGSDGADLEAGSLFHLTDTRPDFALSSAEAEYIAWVNGSKLVTARQSGTAFSLILPCRKGSLEVSHEFVDC